MLSELWGWDHQIEAGTTAQLSSKIWSSGRQVAITGETTEKVKEKNVASLLSLPSLLSTSCWVNLAGSQLIWEPRKCNLKMISPLKYPAEQRNLRDAADEKQAQNPHAFFFRFSLLCVPAANIPTKPLNK